MESGAVEPAGTYFLYGVCDLMTPNMTLGFYGNAEFYGEFQLTVSTVTLYAIFSTCLRL